MTILYSTKTDFHDIRVVEEYPIRKMIFGHGFCSEQSAINLDDLSSHVFDYSYLFMHSMLFNRHPLKILAVGLGGGMVPRELEKYTSAKIDIIELDPEVLRLAKEYFFFKESDRMRVHIGDAFEIVKTLEGKYDIVVVDAYHSNYIPFHIMSREFFQNLFNVVSEDGVVAVNMANVHVSFASHVNTIRSVFGDILYRIDGCRNPNTTMLFALKKEEKVVEIHDRPLCHFLGVKPERLNITDQIKNAEIFSVYNV